MKYLGPLKINKIHNMDCVKGLKLIPNDSIDFIITDPPFNVSLNYDIINDNISNEEYSNWCYEWIVELYRVLKPRHYCVIFTGDKKLYYVFKAIMRTPFKFHHFLKWNKPNNQRALPGTVFFGRTELAFILSKGKPNTKLIHRKTLYSDTIVHKNTTPRDKDAVSHPARRPHKLYEQIIGGLLNQKGVVLDPFMGSGTTMIACNNLNKDFIGFEISKKYIDISYERYQKMRKLL